MEISEPVNDHQVTESKLGLENPTPSPPDPDSPPSDVNHLTKDVENLDLDDARAVDEVEVEVEVEVEEKVSNKDDGDEEGEESKSDDSDDDKNENDNEIDSENRNGNVNGNGNRKRYPFPVRPDAEDCAYYMKTGTCKFGSNCKFNHPIRRKNQVRSEILLLLLCCFFVVLSIFVRMKISP